MGSLIGIVGSEIGPLLQEADQFGNNVASIGNKVIAALPSDSEQFLSQLRRWAVSN